MAVLRVKIIRTAVQVVERDIEVNDNLLREEQEQAALDMAANMAGDIDFSGSEKDAQYEFEVEAQLA